MKLLNISVNIVRNEYEYNKYVSESYRKQYSYEESKASLPWLIVRFNKSWGEDQISKSVLSMSPAADFTNISAAPGGEWSVDTDKSKLKLNLSKENFNVLMLEARKDCGFESLPTLLKVTVQDNLGFEYEAELETVDLSKTEEVLCNLDRRSLQQGGGYLAEVVSVMAQQPPIEVVDALPETPKDNVLYLVTGEE